jgi:glycosyltransferase involved in cell wall biosynthesis
MKKEKRIAIIHDDMLERGGAQKLVLFLAEAIGADVYTSAVSAEVRRIFPSSIRVVSLCDDQTCDKDGLRRRRAFSSFDIASDYDFFIISGEDALRSAARHHPNVYYQHSIPAGLNQDITSTFFHMTHAVSLYNDSVAEKIWEQIYRMKNRFSRVKVPRCFSSTIEALRYFCAYPSWFALHAFCEYRLTDANFKCDLHAVDTVISNSCYTQQRLQTRYSVHSEVVYPPVKVGDYRYNGIGDYWISVNRIHPLKRIELQIETFRRMPDEKLFIVGSMIRDEYEEYYQKLTELKPDNVTFLGVQDDAVLRDLLGRAKGTLAFE